MRSSKNNMLVVSILLLVQLIWAIDEWHREDGAKLDLILITNDMSYVPQGQGE